MKLIKYDLACGQRKPKGFVGVDQVKLPGVDIVFDLRQTPWTFAKDNSADEVRCYHFFEHLTGLERIGFMNELYRILKSGAQAVITTPYYTSSRAVQDPTHMWPPIAETSYVYFSQKWREQNKLDHYPITCNFELKFEFTVIPELKDRPKAEIEYAMKHFFNIVPDLKAILTKI